MLSVLFGEKVTINGQTYSDFRIPVACVVGDTLLVFVEGNLVDDDGGRTDIRQILCIASDDEGLTWSSPVNIAESEVEDWRQKNFHDPSPVVGINGQCLLFYTWSHVQSTSTEPKEQGNLNTISQCRSTNYQTWSNHQALKGQVRLPEWTADWRTGPAKGLMMKHKYLGRLIVPCYYSEIIDEKYLDSYAYIIYSDDGENWQMSNLGPSFTNESTIIETNQGELWHNMRYELDYYRRVRVSTDGGETFKEVPSQQKEHVAICQGSLLQYEGTEKDDEENQRRIFFSCPADDTDSFLDRIRLCLYTQEVKEKADGGANVILQKKRQLYYGDCGYSSLCQIGQRLFIVFEQDGYSKIVFMELINREGQMAQLPGAVATWVYLKDEQERLFSEELNHYLEHSYQTQREDLKDIYGLYDKYLSLEEEEEEEEENEFRIDFNKLTLANVNQYKMIEKNIHRAKRYQLKRKPVAPVAPLSEHQESVPN